MISRERLTELLSYDPTTGAWVWRVSRGSVRAGTTAGSLNSGGYRQIRVDGWIHTAARLAVLYMTGCWPEQDVDHRNRCRADDRWDNLRVATRQQNMGNRPINKNNASGLKGVYWCSQASRWRATISVGGQRKVLGNFRDKAAAHAAYQRAAIEAFGEFANFG